MSVMTVSAVTALAMQCLPPSLAPIAVGIALHENPRLDTAAVYHNKNGTDDRGLTMINDVNLGWLKLTPQTVFEPCANLRASIKVLFARYNGNPPDAVKRAYADGVMSRIQAIDASTPNTDHPATTPTTQQDDAGMDDQPAPNDDQHKQETSKQ